LARIPRQQPSYPLDAVNDAMDDLDAGRLRGRGILIA
jgi:NAD+-dependent secondary alcohol dehydrogenase Adh1